MLKGWGKKKSNTKKGKFYLFAPFPLFDFKKFEFPNLLYATPQTRKVKRTKKGKIVRGRKEK
jgi:hypothetical protein